MPHEGEDPFSNSFFEDEDEVPYVPRPFVLPPPKDSLVARSSRFLVIESIQFWSTVACKEVHIYGSVLVDAMHLIDYAFYRDSNNPQKVKGVCGYLNLTGPNGKLFGDERINITLDLYDSHPPSRRSRKKLPFASGLLSFMLGSSNLKFDDLNLRRSHDFFGKWGIAKLNYAVLNPAITAYIRVSITDDGENGQREEEGLQVYGTICLSQIVRVTETKFRLTLFMVIFCGRLFSAWSLNVVVFMIETNFLLKKKVLYFVFGLKNSVQIFIWLSLVLLAWVLLFNGGIQISADAASILDHVTRALAASLIGAAIWLLKTLLIKTLASKFQCARFFDRIQESIFHQYLVRILSGPPPFEMGMGEAIRKPKSSSRHLSFRNVKKEKKEEIDVDKLKKMKQGKVSAWTMTGLIDVIRGSGLSTISNRLESYHDEEGKQKNTEISSEWEAKDAAYQIFMNVAKPSSKYIEEEDLLRFMSREEVNIVLPMFGAADTGKIKRPTLKDWLVTVYIERKSLIHSLNDTKTAIDELNRLLSSVVLLLALIVWLLLMGFLTTKVLVLISSQLLLVAFMFGNAAKIVFEAIIFVFVMHPFDVGDRCVIDGVQMVVEEMNILTTVFLRYDNEKIFYPNSVLSTKPISNFYRSPEMSDSVEFAVHISTSAESIVALKAKIKAYLGSNSRLWRPDFTVLVQEIEDVNKMKMALYVTHTINFQNYGEKSVRRSELVLELKKYFEELCIEYHLLPQEVRITHVGTTATTIAR